jgi:hypothetical protein
MDKEAKYVPVETIVESHECSAILREQAAQQFGVFACTPTGHLVGPARKKHFFHTS